MQKWKRTVTWALAVALVISLLSGAGLNTVQAVEEGNPQAQTTPTLSETYPEATELMLALGWFEQGVNWTEKVTAEEANKILSALYAGPGFSAAWDPAIPEGDVTARVFTEKSMTTTGWTWGFSLEQKVAGLHLLKGLPAGFSLDQVMTREVCAQITLNILKCQPEYTQGSGFAIKATDSNIGLTLEKVGEDALKRPIYQWKRGETVLTQAYTDTPVAVVRGDVTWGSLNGTAIDGFLEAGNWYNWVQFSYNGGPFSVRDFRNYSDERGLGSGRHYAVEVYDDYTFHTGDLGGGQMVGGFCYTVLQIEVTVGQVSTIDGVKNLTLHGAPGVCYGPWTSAQCNCPELDAKEDGFYVLIFDGVSGTGVNYLEKANVVSGKLTAFDPNNMTVTIDDTTVNYSGSLNLGRDFLSNDNIEKTYSFMLDVNGWLIAILECDHTTWSAWNDTGTTHERYCTYCFLEESGTHTVADDWTPVEGGTHHTKACTVCGGGATTEEHTLSGWTCSTEDATKCVRSCALCGYSESQEHVLGELVDFVAPQVGNPGYSGDRYCTYCNTKLVTGEITTTECTHVPGEPVKENEVAPDCDVPGSYDEVVYCTVEACGEKLSTEHHTLDALEHIWVESEKIEATDYKNGVIRYVCERNDAHTKEEVIPAALTGKTDYPEAIEVLTAVGMLNADDKVWKATLTGAEANKLLQVLYDGPGFINPWSANLTADADVAGTEFLTKLMTPLGYGSWTIELNQMVDWLHLLKGLPADLDLSEPITREVAAQIALNGLKCFPEYDTAGLIKANDPNIGLTLVQVSKDSMGRPSYKWQKNGQDISAVYEDQPIATMFAGKSWNEILNSVGLTQTFAGVGIHGWFKTSENGGELSGYVLHYQDDPESGIYKAEDWYLEIYDNYAKHTDVFAGNGVTFTLHGYTILALSDENIPDDAQETERPSTVPSISHISTDYREAVQLMIALGWIDTNADWKGDITGAEANKILQTLYDAPGFDNPWTAAFSENGKVTGKEFTSAALVTIGWNYGNDPLFTTWNHLEKGLNSSYNSSGNLSREEAAQIILNTLRAVAGYNSENYKYQDSGLGGLTLVLVKEDSMGRPYYKWQKNGVDLTATYRDTPIYAAQAGITWTDLMSILGHVPEVSSQQQFRWCIEGEDMTDFVIKQHPDNNLFLDADYAMEIYQDFHHYHTAYSYTIVCYEGDVNIPQTGDSVNLLLIGSVALAAAAAVCVLLLNKKKYTA